MVERLPCLITALPPTCCLTAVACRGLRISTHWCPPEQPDMLISMARLYDCDGRLLEVGTSTAIKAQQPEGSAA